MLQIELAEAQDGTVHVEVWDDKREMTMADVGFLFAAYELNTLLQKYGVAAEELERLLLHNINEQKLIDEHEITKQHIQDNA